MRDKHRLFLIVCSLSAAALAGCNGSTDPEFRVDHFDRNTLAGYPIHNTPAAWSVSNGFLTGGANALQSVVIRNGETLADGWVETETDQAMDGGLVLRFQGAGSYYLLALRDDSRFGYANFEIYRADGDVFTTIGAPVDVPWIPGTRKTVRFAADGSSLVAYVDGVAVLQATDAAYKSGGFGLRHDNSRLEPGVTSRFDLLRWPAD